MSEKLCALRKVGGGTSQLTETTLWTNSSPNSSFALQDVTLSQSTSGFQYVKIYWKILNTSTALVGSIIIGIEDWDLSTEVNSHLKFGIGSYANGPIVRAVCKGNSAGTKVHFGSSYQTGTSTTHNTENIPTKICGLS